MWSLFGGSNKLDPTIEICDESKYSKLHRDYGKSRISEKLLGNETEPKIKFSQYFYCFHLRGAKGFRQER